MMMTLTDRITHYLLTRLRRVAIHDLYDRVAESGLIESAFIDQPNEKGLIWKLPDVTTVSLTGNTDVDDKFIRRALRLRGDGSILDLATIDHDSGRSIATSGARSGSDHEQTLDGIPSSPGQGAFQSDRFTVLRLLRQRLPPLPVADVAVALLLARAVGESVASLEALIGVLGKTDPMILIRVPTRAFEHRFGVMLEAGLIIPQPMLQVDGFGNTALSGSYRDPGIGRRTITFSGRSIRKRSESALREDLAKARLAHDAPVVIADELSSDLSPRFAATADLVLSCAGIDRLVIAELLQVCVGIAPKISLAAMERQQLDPTELGIDDLVLAVRSGRTVASIVAVLVTLQQQNANPDDDDEAAHDKGRGSKKNNAATPLKKKAVTFDLIEPIPEISVEAMHGTARQAVDASSVNAGRNAVRIETLAGYGEARTWALDLKTDLLSWRCGEIVWPDMSSKLLLAGPPGTGKTMFARALCNSLQLPMLATSVAQWLEKAYLGDVLKEMAAVFEAARQAAPSILFIDEIDNIGRRGGHDQQHSDYWSSLVNRLLELLDGAAKTEGVIVVGATNHTGSIDPALLRSGRLETRVDIASPDTEALAGILAHHLGSDLDRIIASRPLSSISTPEQAAVVNVSSVPDANSQGFPNISTDSQHAGDRP